MNKFQKIFFIGFLELQIIFYEYIKYFYCLHVVIKYVINLQNMDSRKFNLKLNHLFQFLVSIGQRTWKMYGNDFMKSSPFTGRKEAVLIMYEYSSAHLSFFFRSSFTSFFSKKESINCRVLEKKPLKPDLTRRHCSRKIFLGASRREFKMIQRISKECLSRYATLL